MRLNNKAFVHVVREIFQTNESIPLHEPKFSSLDKELVVDAIDSTFVSSVGEYVKQFEEKVAGYTGAASAVATVNGTAALHTALILAGVERNQEVITQALTFVATCNAISYCGADPVFVDVDRATLGMSPIALSEFLARNCEVRDDGRCWNKNSNRILRACVPMHTLGHPVEIHKIQEICLDYRINVIEDSAESLGTFYQGLHTGTFGKIGVLSFNGNKIITTGGGGMLILNDLSLAESAKHLTTTAKVSHPWSFWHDQVGFNYRMPNLNAALGVSQVQKLDSFVNAKRLLASKYAEWFKDEEAIFIEEPKGARSNYWLNGILLSNKNERDEFLEYTNHHGVMTRPIWTPINELPMYQSGRKWCLSNTMWLGARKYLSFIPIPCL